MIILSKYKIQKDPDGTLKMTDIPSSFCPICSEKMKARDSRLRRLLDADGKEYWLRHRRLCCKKCGKVHSEFPDFVMPEKHYSSYVILEQCFSEFTEPGQGVCSAENATIHKWISEILYKLWIVFSFLWETFAKWEIRKNMSVITRFLESLIDKNLSWKHYRKFVYWLYLLEPCIFYV